MAWYNNWGKRSIDLVFSISGLVLLAPLLGLIALALRLSLGKPVLFKQKRPGYLGQCFTLYKFRTMTCAQDAKGELLPDTERLTIIGRFLRATSLDELPELLKVVRSEMSLVGPRPLLMQYLPLYSPKQARRHEVRPGITGWAQVNGRNAISWEDKFRLDVWYVDHLSFWLDVRILWRTFIQVIRRQGISADGHATMPPFTGNQEETRETT